MKHLTVFAIIVAFAAFTSGCATDEYGNRRPMTEAEKGLLIGATSGAVVGALAKKDSRNKGALIGAIGGGIAGVAVPFLTARKR